MQDDRKWMKEEFSKVINRKSITEEEYFRGKTLEDISFLVPLSKTVVATCTLKLSNFLNSALSNPEYYLWFASSVTGPSEVLPSTSDVFSFAGDWVCCAFLCSYEISKLLRLTLYCLSYGNDNGIAMGIAFTPGDVPTNLKLFNSLLHFPVVPDVCIIKPPNKFPLETFVNHGNLVARCHMTLGPRSIVHMEIFEIANEIPPLFPSEPQDGRRIWEAKIKQPNEPNGNDSGLIRNIPYYFEIVNWLRVTLRPGDMLPTNDRSEILSLEGEKFFAGNDETIDAVCAYEIDSTDLVFVAGLKVRPDTRCGH
ncbi:unnamed protein product [Allacma fusca]|uniref:Uncharacterized protein n=1 Tax=Allacma fusca TaxID=39272 RepID=A0A8J2LA91_9HEXA|nr:unnamed protein product [Allacma fusca]